MSVCVCIYVGRYMYLHAYECMHELVCMCMYISVVMLTEFWSLSEIAF